jgi:TolB-like protein
MIGTSVAHYRITAKLGEGGMGVVYRATDTRLGREVALKVLPENFSRQTQSLARFEREAKALAALNHPHIASIYGFDADRATHFLVLELVEGDTLAERLQRGRLPMGEALRVARQIAEAFESAHAKGIIHRDLKPGNLKLTPEGRVKVLDFGLAKMGLEDHASIPDPEVPNLPGAEAPTVLAGTTLAGAVMGTPAYMSPEQARGQPVDKRTDVWAFGCCVFECLTGRRPFPSRTASNLMAEVLGSDPDWSQLPAETPPEVTTLLHGCLEKDPTRRLSSMGDIALTLHEVTRVASGSHRPTPALRTKGALRPWLAVTAMAVVALVAGWWIQSKYLRNPSRDGKSTPNASSGREATGPGRIESLVVMPLENLSGDPTKVYFVDGMAEELITRLSKLSALKKVISLTSARQYRQDPKSAQEIAQQFQVDAVVEGSVLESGNQVRVSVRLIDGATARNIWADSYVHDLTNVIRLQNEVAQAIAREIKAVLTPEEQGIFAHDQPVNPDAYRAYLLARHYWYQFTPDAFQKALEAVTESIRIDPEFGPAHAALARCYVSMANTQVLPPRQALEKANQAMVRALQLGASGEALEAQAAIGVFLEWDWPGARRNLDRALSQIPHDAAMHALLSWYYVALRKFPEAMNAARSAAAYEPLGPLATVCPARVLLYERRYTESLEEYRKVFDSHPGVIQVVYGLGRSYELAGEPAKAIAVFETALQRGRVPMLLEGLASAFVSVGRIEEARRLAVELESKYQQAVQTRRGYVSPWHLAMVSMALGEPQKALDWLERGFEERGFGMILIDVEPAFDGLRREPRFGALLKRMNLIP